MLLNTVKTQARSLANGHYLLIPLLFWILAGIAGCSGGGSGGSTPKTPLGTATITGTVQYQDKEYGSGGFTNIILTKAVRYALIEVVDPSDGAVLGSTRTSSTGQYSAAFTFYGDTAYVRVISDARITGGNPVKVRNLSGALYAVRGSDVTASSGAPLTANITVNASGAGGAFNILDALTSGFEFVSSLSGTYPPTLSAFWEQNSPTGTYYCTGCSSPGDGIYVIGNSGGDTDGYDDDVVWHEFGHFIADKFSRDESPGGYHYLTDNEQDMRLSWSEGWGNFFTGAVKYWLTDTSPDLLSTTAAMPTSLYVDTFNASGWSFDFNTTAVSPYVYSSSEVAVAKVLWSLMTGTGNFRMQSIWDIVASPTFTAAATPVNLELLWDGWLLRSSIDSEMITLRTIFENRLITYSSDSFEPDSAYTSASTYTVGAPQNHTLYPNSDEDYVVFSATTGSQYTITTSSLRNGADTYLTLYSSGGTTVVASNDNGNGTGITYVSCPSFNLSCDNSFPLNNLTNLSSKIQFNATYNGQYYVEIKSSPVRPNSAGRYGNYLLTIISP